VAGISGLDGRRNIAVRQAALQAALQAQIRPPSRPEIPATLARTHSKDILA
jgi:hypothetical protein